MVVKQLVNRIFMPDDKINRSFYVNNKLFNNRTYNTHSLKKYCVYSSI